MDRPRGQARREDRGQRAARAVLSRRAARGAWRLSAERICTSVSRETGDWNDPQCLTDFVWTRAHPRARKKLPNRTSRGSQFGYEDFAAFCALSATLGRPVTHMVRGHDHVEERYEIYPAYARDAGAHDRRAVAAARARAVRALRARADHRALDPRLAAAGLSAAHP